MITPAAAAVVIAACTAVTVAALTALVLLRDPRSRLSRWLDQFDTQAVP